MTDYIIQNIILLRQKYRHFEIKLEGEIFMSYQVRVSLETAMLLEELKSIYEEQEKTPVSKGDVLIRSFYDSKWVTNWDEILSEEIKIKKDYNIKTNALRPRFEITDEVEQGIKKMKCEIAKALKLRSITIGVTIKLILKASYIKNLNSVKNDAIHSAFQKYKSMINADTNFSKEHFITLLNGLEEEIKNM